MREFLLFRSFDRIILNILSLEKDLLRLKKEKRITKSIRILLKSIIKTRMKLFLLIPGKKFLFFDNFGSKTNILGYFAFHQKPSKSFKMILFILKMNFIMEKGSLFSNFDFIMLILGFLPQDDLNTSNVISKAIFHLYTSSHIR